MLQPALRQEDGDSIVIETPTGAQFKRPLASIQKIDFGSGNSEKLTNLTPERVQVQPYFDVGQKPNPDNYFRTGKSFYGPLALGPKQFDDGIAMRSHTTADYRLKEEFRQFRGIIGLNQTVQDVGKARLVITGDGKPLLDKMIEGKKEERIEVNIEGVKRLTFEVDFGDGSDVGDVLDIVNPRLFR